MLTELGLALAAFTTGVLNTAGGGGAIVTFLALNATGVPALTAHATSQLVTPASFVTAAPLATTYPPGVAMLVTGCLGTVIGVAILAATPPMTFQALAPWVLVPAAIVVVVQDAVKRRLRRGARIYDPRIAFAAMLSCGIYAGLIGVGTGTIAVGVLGLTTRWAELRTLMLVRNVLLFGMATVVGGTFAVTGLVDWRLAMLLAVPGLLGGWVGTHLVGRLPASALRALIVTTAVSGAAWMVLR
jgi:uncharacterized membrane protein YfcA